MLEFGTRRVGECTNHRMRRHRRLRLALVFSSAAVTLGILSATAAATPSIPAGAATAGYLNPLRGDRYVTGRTDMGVDFCMIPGEPIRAIGNGVVVGIFPDWFKHQPYVWYRLLDGPYAGSFVYVAEQITRIARVGAYLQAGQPVAYYKRSGTCIEMGWSSTVGSTLAHITSGYREGQVTPAGVAFARMLISMGVKGPFELTATTKRKS